MRTLRTRTLNRKKLVATAKLCERIYKRTAEPSVTFCGEEEQRNGRLIFLRSKIIGASEACSDEPVSHLGTIIHIAKSITPFSCSFVNALATLNCR